MDFPSLARAFPTLPCSRTDSKRETTRDRETMSDHESEQPKTKKAKTKKAKAMTATASKSAKGGKVGQKRVRPTKAAEDEANEVAPFVEGLTAIVGARGSLNSGTLIIRYDQVGTVKKSLFTIWEALHPDTVITEVKFWEIVSRRVFKAGTPQAMETVAYGGNRLFFHPWAKLRPGADAGAQVIKGTASRLQGLDKAAALDPNAAVVTLEEYRSAIAEISTAATVQLKPHAIKTCTHDRAEKKKGKKGKKESSKAAAEEEEEEEETEDEEAEEAHGAAKAAKAKAKATPKAKGAPKAAPKATPAKGKGKGTATATAKGKGKAAAKVEAPVVLVPTMNGYAQAVKSIHPEILDTVLDAATKCMRRPEMMRAYQQMVRDTKKGSQMQILAKDVLMTANAMKAAQSQTYSDDEEEDEEVGDGEEDGGENDYKEENEEEGDDEEENYDNGVLFGDEVEESDDGF